MMRCVGCLGLAVLLVIGLSGCSDEPAPTSAPAKPRAVAKPPAKSVPPPVADDKQAEDKKPQFVYESEGRRDPFLPLTAIKKPLDQAEEEPLTPLQQYELQQYRLLGVIVGLDEPRAMVAAPDGKSYILKKGVKIGKNNGVVIDITDKVIQVEEKYYDFSGNVRTNIQDIVVPKREGV
ncbi:MAG: pilus assembly protein PilP [Desulfuromonadales bacterium]|nr:pilus assembly protein PilP [Desulfuromonadales bacterium]